MAEILPFPASEDREWMEWEDMIRSKAAEASCPDDAVALALPRIREHWTVVFAPATMELPARPVPGKLTAQQAKVIQGLIEASAAVVLDRLNKERVVSFQRLIEAELRAACFQVLAAKP